MMRGLPTFFIFVFLALTVIPVTASADVRPEQIRERTVDGLTYKYPEGAEKAVDQLVEAAPTTIEKLDRELRLLL